MSKKSSTFASEKQNKTVVTLFLYSLNKTIRKQN